jgi:DNA polymerase-4
VQQGIRNNVGASLGSSVGLAPSRLLAKLASTMQKPNGLTVLRKPELPGPILHLRLKDIPGVGENMARRLAAAGIGSVEQLWGVTPYRARRIWGSVEGDRIWHGLHGADNADAETERSSIGHANVLAPEFREIDQARLVARRLVVKCGARLRRMDLKAAALCLTLDTETHLTGTLQSRFPPTHDTFALLSALEGLWTDAATELAGRRLRFVSIQCEELEGADARPPDLFGWTPGALEDPRRLRLSHALDTLNRRFGKDTVTIGAAPDIDYLGAKIAFSRIPEPEEFAE